MRRSQLFSKTRRETPADEASLGAQLLIRAGYVHKEMAGVYSLLPLGKRTLDNIVAVIRDEMNSIGGQEVVMTTLQDRELWQITERWDSETVDVWFKTTLQNGHQLGLAWSHEEPMTRAVAQFVNSHRDLPIYVYQFQNKLRNELRAKSGLLRAREFLMKDLYSFCRSREEHEGFYQLISQAYMRVYDRLGIGDITYKTFAGGGAFSKYSDEFQTISPVGEDTIYVHEQKRLAINQEVFSDKILADLGLDKTEMVEKTAVEVGNIFSLGTRFSEPLGLYFSAEDGSQQPVYMGCYGIGPSRLMGLLAEHFADSQGLNWPQPVAPFQAYLASLGENEEINRKADELYQQLTSAGAAVLYDDREARAGEKFADADLIGLPYRIVVSARSLQQGLYELKRRGQSEPIYETTEQIIGRLAGSPKT